MSVSQRQRLDDIPHNTEDDSDLSACISSIVPFDVLENSPQSPAGLLVISLIQLT